MPNINACRPVVYQKIFLRLPQLSPILAAFWVNKGISPLKIDINKF